MWVMLSGFDWGMSCGLGVGWCCVCMDTQGEARFRDLSYARGRKSRAMFFPSTIRSVVSGWWDVYMCIKGQDQFRYRLG